MVFPVVLVAVPSVTAPHTLPVQPPPPQERPHAAQSASVLVRSTHADPQGVKPLEHLQLPVLSHVMFVPQEFPLATGLEHTPVVVSQVPAEWHLSLAVHVTGFDPVQVPPWQE